MADLDQWPSASDVARMANVSPEWIRFLVRSGKLEAKRTRVGTLIDPDSARQLCEKRSQPGYIPRGRARPRA